MATSNEQLRDAITRHRVNIERASARTRARLIDLLDGTEAEIHAEIVRRLQGVATGEGPVDISDGTAALRRLQFLEDALAEIRGRAMADFADGLEGEMRDLVRNEAEFAANVVEEHVPVVLDMALPAVELLNALVDGSPFQGKVMADWASRLASEDLERLNTAVRNGMVRGLSNDEIGRSIVGSQSMNGADGALQVTRNQADTIARTATNFLSNAARSATFEENGDVVGKEMYTATLDDRTTVECASLDGNLYDVGEGPQPPIHWNCRSTRVPVIDAENMGTRPMKESTERDLVGEYADANGIELEGAATRDNLPRGSKGAFDAFARTRVRELTGPAPAVTTYSVFLGRQSNAFQAEVLGATKARLFRDGGLQLSKFINRSGDELTLSELAARDRAAFVKAGLDPKQYR